MKKTIIQLFFLILIQSSFLSQLIAESNQEARFQENIKDSKSALVLDLASSKFNLDLLTKEFANYDVLIVG